MVPMRIRVSLTASCHYRAASPSLAVAPAVPAAATSRRNCRLVIALIKRLYSSIIRWDGRGGSSLSSPTGIAAGFVSTGDGSISVLLVEAVNAGTETVVSMCAATLVPISSRSKKAQTSTKATNNPSLRRDFRLFAAIFRLSIFSLRVKDQLSGAAGRGNYTMGAEQKARRSAQLPALRKHTVTPLD